eukprot:2549891-Heterocapsa_arctica.AAC.1
MAGVDGKPIPRSIPATPDSSLNGRQSGAVSFQLGQCCITVKLWSILYSLVMCNSIQHTGIREGDKTNARELS